MKTKGVGKLGLFEHTRWYSSTKADKYPAVFFSDPCRSRWFIFTKQIIVLFWVIIYSYLQRFFKIGVIKTLYTIHRKATVSESLFNKPVACYFFNEILRQRCFLKDIAKLSRTPVLHEHLKTPDSVFMEYICNYNIIKRNVSQPKCLFQPFDTLINMEMVKWKLYERCKLFSLFSSDSVKFIIKCG